MKSLTRAVPIALVLLLYAFYGSDGTFEFRRISGRAEYDRERGRFGLGYYPSLAEGFLHGQLSMYEKVPPKLAALGNPWEPEERGKADAWALWDASYLNGRYYLYFSAVPVVLLYIPYKLLAHGYPNEGFAAAFFAAWAFIASVMFVRRALADRTTRVPMWFWIVFLGIGNLVPYLLVFARTYEVATICGAAMNAMWAYELPRFLQAPSPRRAFWMGLWLAMAIAARPNIGVLLVPAAIAFMLVAKPVRMRAAIAALIPLAVVAIVLLAYNYARFNDPFEFGIRYQITVTSMFDKKVCSLCAPRDIARWANNLGQYLFVPVGIWSQFPFAILYRANLDPATMFPSDFEPTAGIFSLIPITLIGTFAALMLAALAPVSSRAQSRDPLPKHENRSSDGDSSTVFAARNDTGLRAAMLVMLGAWLVMMGLCACWAVDGRYTIDFALLMTTSSVICIEAALARIAPSLRRPAITTALLIILGSYSMFLGLALGIDGKNGAFRKVNPDTYHLLAKPFGTPRE